MRIERFAQSDGIHSLGQRKIRTIGETYNQPRQRQYRRQTVGALDTHVAHFARRYYRVKCPLQIRVNERDMTLRCEGIKRLIQV